MNKFSEAYKKLRDVITEQTYEADWEKFIWGSGKAQKLLGEDGLSLGGSELLDEIRFDRTGRFLTVENEAGDRFAVNLASREVFPA